MSDLLTNRTILSDEERSILAQALEKIRKEIRWKPGKDIIHLEKRQRMKHLVESTSIADYGN